MHWVLSKNLQTDRTFPVLIEQLERQSTPYTIIGTVPFSGEVLVVEGDQRLEDITGPVFGCGKGSMRLVAHKYGWTPGYIDACDQIECLEHYNTDMLNDGAVIGRLGDVVPSEPRFFVRPNADDKSFSGQLMTKVEFLEWQARIGAMDDAATLTKDDIIILAPLKEIHAEYRFYVVDGRVVTGSLYKRGHTVTYDECRDERVIGFARWMVEKFCPSIAFVLDIADTPSGLKVLETNSISSSGFYAIDIGKFVTAINRLR
jgi:hypothetical protein